MGRGPLCSEEIIMIRRNLINLAALGVLFSTPATADAQNVQFRSKVYDQTSGTLLYLEQHDYVQIGSTPQTASVQYLSPRGEPLAVKTLDFSFGETTPLFLRQEQTTGYVEGFRPLEGDPNAGRLIARTGSAEPTCSKVFEATPDLVVDAGFNIFLQENLPTLKAGQTVRFDLLIPKACRTVEFEATGQMEGGRVRVDLAPSSFVLRMLVPNTTAYYNAETGHLEEYLGLSDLTDEDGRSMTVRIVFDPPAVMPQTLPIAAR